MLHASSTELMLAVIAGFIVLYTAFASRVERTWISGPIVFTAFGFLLGPAALGVLRFTPDAGLLRLLAELTLALVLFTDAASTSLRRLRAVEFLPARLLLIGLPLTILCGAGVGWIILPGLSLVEIALLATMLAPTDAALGKPVIVNESVPEPVREGLNVESGLNDGICVPILFLFLAMAQEEAMDQSPWRVGVVLVLKQIGIGVAVGALLAALAGALLVQTRHRGWWSRTWSKVTLGALALTCFGAAQALGGSGFIAAFAGGLAFGAVLKPHHGPLLDAAEGIGDAFSLVTWTFFGATVIPLTLAALDWRAAVYALLSLTAIRMVPVCLALVGTRVDLETRLFLGWFGPRGLATIVFAVMVLDAGLPGSSRLATIAAFTVIVSIVAHGASALPWVRSYRRRPHEFSAAP